MLVCTAERRDGDDSMPSQSRRSSLRTNWFKGLNAGSGGTATWSGEAAVSRVNLIDLAIYITWIGIVATIFI